MCFITAQWSIARQRNNKETIGFDWILFAGTNLISRRSILCFLLSKFFDFPSHNDVEFNRNFTKIMALDSKHSRFTKMFWLGLHIRTCPDLVSGWPGGQILPAKITWMLLLFLRNYIFQLSEPKLMFLGIQDFLSRILRQRLRQYKCKHRPKHSGTETIRIV